MRSSPIKDQHIMIPGWPYSVICALEPGRSAWTAPLDARRLAPGDEAAEITTAQVRQVVDGLMGAGQWQPGDPDRCSVRVDQALFGGEPGGPFNLSGPRPAGPV
jgi:hypothetical protein